mmetsp:Transcript_24361/g.39118  ORF Transcript_24361/g.39118 Transcript_24361/m.39118 type:complete len:446 (+) Transcript_24361:64-1401(+)
MMKTTRTPEGSGEFLCQHLHSFKINPFLGWKQKISIAYRITWKRSSPESRRDMRTLESRQLHRISLTNLSLWTTRMILIRATKNYLLQLLKSSRQETMGRRKNSTRKKSDGYAWNLLVPESALIMKKKKAETAMNAARALRDMIPNRNSGFDKRSIKESLQVNSSQTGNVIPYMGHDSIEGAVLHLDILEANAKIVNLEWEKKQIKAECEHLRRSLDTRKDSTTKLFKTHEEIYSLTRRLRQEAHERSADWSRCCRKHADDIHRLAKGLERVQKGLEGMRRVAVRMKSNVLVFRKDMTRQLAFVSSKLSQLERLDNTKRLKLERISTHKKSLEKELLQSKKEIRRVGAWAKSVLTENEINQRSHKDLESKHNDLKEQFRLFKAGRKLMQQHLTSLLKENENLTSEKNDLEIQLQDLHSNSTKRIVQVVDEVLSQMNNHTKDNKQR